MREKRITCEALMDSHQWQSMSIDSNQHPHLLDKEQHAAPLVLP